jgi:hypothetical protein
VDIYDFFNSPDIAGHCKEIERVWNILEMAVIVNMSHRPMAEKHMAYRELLSTQEDMTLLKSLHHDGGESVHKYLRKFLEFEERNTEYFLTPDPGAVYHLEVLEKDSSNMYDDGLYSSFDNAVRQVEERHEHGNIERVLVTRRVLDAGEKVEGVSFHVSLDGELLELWRSRIFEDNDEEVRHFFEDFYIDVPAPFQKGDILKSRGFGFYNSHSGIGVLNHLDRNHPHDPNRLARCLQYGDTSDMYAAVYYMSNDGFLWHDRFPYTDLAYYKGEFEGTDRLLKYVSRYLKRELDLPNLLAMQNKIMLEQLIESGTIT